MTKIPDNVVRLPVPLPDLSTVFVGALSVPDCTGPSGVAADLELAVHHRADGTIDLVAASSCCAAGEPRLAAIVSMTPQQARELAALLRIATVPPAERITAEIVDAHRTIGHTYDHEG